MGALFGTTQPGFRPSFLTPEPIPFPLWEHHRAIPSGTVTPAPVWAEKVV